MISRPALQHLSCHISLLTSCYHTINPLSKAFNTSSIAAFFLADLPGDPPIIIRGSLDRIESPWPGPTASSPVDDKNLHPWSVSTNSRPAVITRDAVDRMLRSPAQTLSHDSSVTFSDKALMKSPCVSPVKL